MLERKKLNLESRSPGVTESRSFLVRYRRTYVLKNCMYKKNLVMHNVISFTVLRIEKKPIIIYYYCIPLQPCLYFGSSLNVHESSKGDCFLGSGFLRTVFAALLFTKPVFVCIGFCALLGPLFCSLLNNLNQRPWKNLNMKKGIKIKIVVQFHCW